MGLAVDIDRDLHLILEIGEVRFRNAISYLDFILRVGGEAKFSLVDKAEPTYLEIRAFLRLELLH